MCKPNENRILREARRNPNELANNLEDLSAQEYNLY
jgi:hypothetical protein